MRTLMIISPHFPPVNTADMHRIRMSLSYFADFGWSPIVLTVEPKFIARGQDQLLNHTIPESIPVFRTRALPTRWTRTIGLNDLGLRALPHLHHEGTRLIEKYRPDLVYFSTTMFATMALGRLWRGRFGTPYVLDIQDPWVTGYYDTNPPPQRAAKQWIAQRLHRQLEPWAMRDVAGIIAVSEAYIHRLRERYPSLETKPCEAIPFGGFDLDFQILKQHRQPNKFFHPKDGLLHGVYTGRGGLDMHRSLKILFLALRQGLEHDQALFSRVRLHFIGTDYAPREQARKTVKTVANEIGVGEMVTEHTDRVQYFQALQLLADADFLVVPGSDDPDYTASKIYPYIMARKPMIAIFRRESGVVRLLRDTGAADVITFSHESDPLSRARTLVSIWRTLLLGIPSKPTTNWEAFRPYTAREMTRRQSEVFDRITNGRIQ